jgi:hypothetical protein
MNAAKSCCKFLFGEQHIYNDMGIGYIISHPITTAQLRYMHLTGITPATDTEHTGYYITDYSNRPTHDNPLDEQQQICIYTAYNKPPIPSNYEHNLYITLINNHDADNIDYSLHPMIVVPQYAMLGQHTTCLVGAILCTGKHMLVETDVTHHSTDITVVAIWPPVLQAPTPGEHQPPPAMTRAPSSLQCLPSYQQIWYGAFHMTGAAHLWYIRVTKEAPFPEWDTFVKDLISDFGPPLSHDTLGDMASPRHDVDLNDYINMFHAYIRRVGIASELHRVHLFVTNLGDALWATGLLV